MDQRGWTDTDGQPNASGGVELLVGRGGAMGRDDPSAQFPIAVDKTKGNYPFIGWNACPVLGKTVAPARDQTTMGGTSSKEPRFYPTQQQGYGAVKPGSPATVNKPVDSTDLAPTQPARSQIDPELF